MSGPSKPDSTGAAAVTCRTSVLRANGRLVVCCGVEHFIPSGMTVSDLLARLRPQLETAILDAAARDPGAKEVATSTSVQMDMDGPDPGISLWVHNPARVPFDLDAHMERLRAVVARMVASMPPVEGA